MAVSMPFCRRSRNTSKPVFFGNITSSTIRSKPPASALASPNSPSPAESISYPSAANRSDMVTTNPGSSSINRMRELILKLRRRCRYAQDELGPPHGPALHPDTPAMRLHDFLHQVQSQ